MLERCPRCSAPRDAEREKANSSGSVAACANCGYTGAPFNPSDEQGPRPPLSTFAGARARLATATQDLFRLSGNSIPVEAELSAPPPPPPPQPVEDPTSGRKAEASIMFSLEALMKANSPQAEPQSKADEAPDQLWSMQGATPLFGTEYDQALLTTPLKTEQTSMDSMTVPSRRPPAVRRLVPLLLAIAGGSTALAGVGWWAFGPTESEASQSAEVAAIETSEPSAEPEAPATPAPGSEPAAPADPAHAAEAAAQDAPPAEAEKPAEAPPEAQASANDAAEAEDKPDSDTAAKSKKKSVTSKRATKPRATAPSSAKAPFSTSAARDALSAAAARAASCKGGSGSGKMQVTFATSGRVSSAQIVSGPSAGSAAGKCALRHFKAAKVPAFTGSPTTVAKSFKIP